MDWDEPYVVVVFPAGLVSTRVSLSVTVPDTSEEWVVGWQAVTTWLEQLTDVASKRPLGAVVQRPNQPAIRARH
jgi:hypothetical protein